MSQLEGCRLQGIEFEDCKLVGVNFAACEKKFMSLNFKNCLIDTCNFSFLDLKNTRFLSCVLRDGYFAETNLTLSDFSKTDLKGTVFHNVNLRKADFREAFNYAINPATNQLTKAKFSSPDVLSLLSYLDIEIDS